MSVGARWLVAAALLLASGGGLAAQDVAPSGDTLVVRALWDAARAQPHDATLSFLLSRALQRADGRLAVIVGRADLSPLVEVRGTTARLPLRGEHLPTGDLAVEAWLVDADGRWREAGRFALRRLGRAGLESLTVRPTLDLQGTGQLDAGPVAVAAASPRGAAFRDATLSAGLEGGARRAGTGVRWQAALAGASHAPARLRAAQLGARAPVVDLASYALRATRGAMSLSAGHLALGTHRLLASQFRSRGVALDVGLGRRLFLAAGSAAGSELVGWDDPLGLARPAHRVSSGTLALEALPARPGALRLELSALDGSLQPRPAFAQQAVTDRETSRGIGVQVAAADPAQRLRLSMGFARSRFDNPRDSALEGDAHVVAVRPETRAARFGELAFDALRAHAFGPVRASLSLAARHERADPLYRSVAATAVQADRAHDALEATGALGAVQWQLSATRGRDNLAGVPSLLVTRTATQGASASAPLVALVRARPDAAWTPTLAVTWQATTQRADTTPPRDGGFRAPFQLPHQRTENLTATAAWARARWNASVRLDRSVVDNRQAEREQADFHGWVRALTLGVTPGTSLTLAIDLTHESLRSVELAAVGTTRRAGVQATWRPHALTTVDAAASLVATREPAATPRARSVEGRIELSQGFNAWVRPADGSQARAFLRWARSGQSLRGPGLPSTLTAQWTLSGGLGVRLF